jgi:ribosome recycling factor
MSETPERVEKLMALTLAEFHRPLKTLAPKVSLNEKQTEIEITADKSNVRVVYEALESATLGGLLALPRARVTLHLDELDQSQRQAFIKAFDKAFQRGGG